MRIKITGLKGESAEAAVGNRLAEILSRVKGKAAQEAALAMRDTIRTHFQTRFPGSSHYSPDKVNVESTSVGSTEIEASVVVDVPGVSRAYHDITIVPRYRQYLTIPFEIARGHKAEDYRDAFVVTKKDSGFKFLAENRGGTLVALFSLVKKAF